MYEDKIDVRSIISRFTGYYLLISLPIITVMALYCSEYVEIFANEKFYMAFKLIPYFAFGTFFLALTDYTTLQYHLANKTYIDFVIKMVSGVVGVILNIILIPQYGLVGVGIATLIANFLYFVLSVLIVLPNLRLKFPTKMVLRIFFSFIPFFMLYFWYSYLNVEHAVCEMSSLLVIFYLTFWLITLLCKRFEEC